MISDIRFRRLLLIIIIFVALFCVLMVIKPGASIFYYPRILSDEYIEHDGEFAYVYTLKENILLGVSNQSIFLEDGKALIPSTSTTVFKVGNGTYSLTDPLHDQYYLYFAPLDNSDPRSNGREYILLQPIVLFSRPLGVAYLLFLLLGLTLLGTKKLRNPADRKVIMDGAVEAIKESIPNLVHIKKLFTLMVATAYTYIFMEWLFFITKPSFMDIMQFVNKLGILLQSGFIFSMIGIIALLVLAAVDFLFSFLKLPQIWFVSGLTAKPILENLVSIFGLLIPSSILTALALLLIDNFTYVLFDFGVVTSNGIQRNVYAVIIICLLIYFYSFLLKYLNRDLRDNQKSVNVPLYLLLSLLIISGIPMLAGYERPYSSKINTREIRSQQAADRPNILLIGGDGINARHMSAYGYERDTTPRIKELAQISLLAENAFPNAAHSAGSVISIFTSKLPTQTRVLYPPDILTGTDSFLHLPGILRREGYKTVEIGVPHYVDSYNLNLQNGFDLVNGIPIDETANLSFLRENGYEDAAYFITQLKNRIIDRLLHIFLIKDMENPYSIVTQPVNGEWVQGQGKTDQLIDLLNTTEQPLFVHLHLMGSHGPIFSPELQVFSSGQEQTEEWMVDFYDDAILNFDSYVGEVLDTLNKNHHFDNTILIIYTDHGQNYTLNERLPLIIHFPHNEHQGRIPENVQNLDISPTIIDYLGLPQEHWMAGHSLLRDDYPDRSLIFSMGTRSPTVALGDGRSILDLDRISPPFFQFGFINIIDCQIWHNYELNTQKWSSGEVVGHTAPCEEGLLNHKEIKTALREHLSIMGFDTTSIR